MAKVKYFNNTGVWNYNDFANYNVTKSGSSKVKESTELVATPVELLSGWSWTSLGKREL